MKNTYCRQKYLFETDFSNIETNILPISSYDFENIQDYYVPYNLFDYNQVYIRKISTDVLDEKADTLEKFKEIADNLSDVDELVLIDSRKQSKNSDIINSFAETTLKAYIGLFYKYGIKNITIVKSKKLLS